LSKYDPDLVEDLIKYVRAMDVADDVFQNNAFTKSTDDADADYERRVLARKAVERSLKARKKAYKIVAKLLGKKPRSTVIVGTGLERK